jgi:hypothetical protein
MQGPQPPAHLSPSARKFWRTTVERYELQEQTSLFAKTEAGGRICQAAPDPSGPHFRANIAKPREAGARSRTEPRPSPRKPVKAHGGGCPQRADPTRSQLASRCVAPSPADAFGRRPLCSASCSFIWRIWKGSSGPKPVQPIWLLTHGTTRPKIPPDGDCGTMFRVGPSRPNGSALRPRQARAYRACNRETP